MAWALASGLESSTQGPVGLGITTLRSYLAGDEERAGAQTQVMDEGTWNEGVRYSYSSSADASEFLATSPALA